MANEKSQNDMSSEKEIPSDCITAGEQNLKADPNGRVLWLSEENHAYFVPGGAKPDHQIQGLLKAVTIAGRKFRVLSRQVSELDKMVEDGGALDITNLLLPKKK